MSQVILQPAGSKEASEHYVDTIENPVSIDRLANFIDATTVERLKELRRDGRIPVWGVTPGKDGGNHKKWERVQPGDVVLFSRDNKIFASASVALKLHNEQLAEELWKRDSAGDTWEYVYFLDEVHKQDIPYEAFNKVVGYKENFIIQGFNVLDQEKSEAVLSFFNLESGTYQPPVSQDEYLKAIEIDPSKSLEKEGVVKGRTEQAFLRSMLFQGKKYSICGICGREYPVSFLVAAHIKKRSLCTDEEKRDFRNIVIPMCKFGCDELYERGYIAVDEGKVIISNYSDTTEAISAYIKEIVDRGCKYWNEANAKYFRWHLENTGDGSNR